MNTAHALCLLFGAAAAFSTPPKACVDAQDDVVQAKAKVMGYELSGCNDVASTGLCTHAEAVDLCCRSCASSELHELRASSCKDQCCSNSDCQFGEPVMECGVAAIVSEAECLAVGVAQGGVARGGRLVVGAWGHVPPGCSYQSGGDGGVHFNHNENGVNDGSYTPVRTAASDVKIGRCGSCYEGRCQGGDPGARCHHDYECRWACVESYCTSGSPGDKCEKNADCKHPRTGVAPGFCHHNRCMHGNYGDDCTNDVDCLSNICSLGKCTDGKVGDACDGDFDCAEITSPSDSTQTSTGKCVNRNTHKDKIGPNTCQAGQDGSYCESDSDCPFSRFRRCHAWRSQGDGSLGNFANGLADAADGPLGEVSEAAAVATVGIAIVVNHFDKIKDCY